MAIIENDYLIKHLEIFSNEKCKVIRTFEHDDMFKNDEEHKRLMKAKKKASDDFYNYEFNLRHKHK